MLTAAQLFAVVFLFSFPQDHDCSLASNTPTVTDADAQQSPPSGHVHSTQPYEAAQQRFNRFAEFQYPPAPEEQFNRYDTFCRLQHCQKPFDVKEKIPCENAEESAMCSIAATTDDEDFMRDVSMYMVECQRNRMNPYTLMIEVQGQLNNSYEKTLNQSIQCGWWRALRAQKLSAALVTDAITKTQIMCEQGRNLEPTSLENEELINNCILDVWKKVKKNYYISRLLKDLGITNTTHEHYDELYDMGFPLIAIKGEFGKSEALRGTIKFLPECLTQYGLKETIIQTDDKTSYKEEKPTDPNHLASGDVNVFAPEVYADKKVDAIECAYDKWLSLQDDRKFVVVRHKSRSYSMFTQSSSVLKYPNLLLVCATTIALIAFI